MLLLTPEEGAQVRDLLPEGPLRSYVSGLVNVDLIPAPIPEIVVFRAFHDEAQLELFDEEVANAMWAALQEVIAKRWKLATLPHHLAQTVTVVCPSCRAADRVHATRNALGEPLWYRCMACGGFGWDAQMGESA